MASHYLSARVRRWLNRFSLALMFVFAALAVFVAIAPGRHQIGSLAISMRSLRNPVCGMALAYIVWRATYDGFGGWLLHRLWPLESGSQWLIAYGRRTFANFLATWRSWDWRGRCMFALVAGQALLVARFWEDYPSVLSFERMAMANAYTSPTYKINGERLPTLECFGRSVREQLPPDARILFHGRTAVLRFAYEVYPRRVFMLPQEMRELAATWHVQPQLRDLPDDPHLRFWHDKLPTASIEPAEFIREHRIDFIATFDENDLAACRVEAAR
jgi:hypothetical protein